MLDQLLGTVAHERGSPLGLIMAPFALARQSLDLVQLALPSLTSMTAWVELMNKMEAFLRFECEQGRDCSTAQAGLSPTRYASLWSTEGRGHAVAASALSRSEEPGGLLAEPGLAGDPSEGILIPLHTGMGLAVAGRVLSSIRRGSSPREIRATVERFVTLCERNAREGYAGAAIEALGLAARTLYPLWIPGLDRELLAIRDDLPDYFWHGVGRALYFTPTNLLPSSCAGWSGAAKAAREAPHETGRRNATAGLAWALTLVNIRDPLVIELFVSRHGDRLIAPDAFANGVRSAAQVWRAWAPDTPYLDALRGHRTDPRSASLGHRWDDLVRRPCEASLEVELADLQAGRRVGELFRDRPGATGRGPPRPALRRISVRSGHRHSDKSTARVLPSRRSSLASPPRCGPARR